MQFCTNMTKNENDDRSVNHHSKVKSCRHDKWLTSWQQYWLASPDAFVCLLGFWFIPEKFWRTHYLTFLAKFQILFNQHLKRAINWSIITFILGHIDVVLRTRSLRTISECLKVSLTLKMAFTKVVKITSDIQVWCKKSDIFSNLSLVE